MTFEEAASDCRVWMAGPVAQSYFNEWRFAADRAADDSSMDYHHPQDYEDIQLLAFCQRMWEYLPDRPEIRSPAFFTLCDFAEYYCNEAEIDKVEVQKNEAALDSYLQNKEK